MQLTRFDRWLREKFVYETHIHTLRPPESVPKGIRVIQQPEVPGKRYKHLFVAGSTKLADQLIDQLKQNSQMYTTHVVDRTAWYIPFIAPKNRSVSWWIITAILFMISAFFVLTYLQSLIQNPAFRKNFSEALEILKG